MTVEQTQSHNGPLT